MALLPPGFLNTVVALGSAAADSTVRYHSTGFLYGHPTGIVAEDGQKQYQLFLVTNRHVFQKASELSGTLYARFNRPVKEGVNEYPISMKDTSWTIHPDTEADVAVLGINAQKIRDDGIEFSFFAGDDQAFTLEQAQTNQVSEGDGVFVLGFPLGQAGDERNYVIVRQGIIARLQNWLWGNARIFLIDSSIFPGNSGGPVLLKPELTSIQGTKANNKCSLIGMVSSYLPYQEVAISQQTGRPRMAFEENSGLATVVPNNVIQEAIEVAVGKIISAQTMPQ